MDPDYIRLKEIKPELAGYIADAMELLKRSPAPDDNAVHEMRVLLKKSRAALKLIRPQIQNGYADMDIQTLKEAAGIMSSWRDTSVLRKTLKDLRKDHPSLISSLENDSKISSILKKPEKSEDPSPAMLSGTETIETLLKKCGFRIRFHPMDNLDPQLLLKELETTYMKVTDVFLKCRNYPKEKKLHEFRKKSKDFMYQLYFFRPLNDEVIKQLIKKLELMTRNLGKINDLAQLVKALDYKYPGSEDPVIDELVVRIREKQDAFLEKVWPAASKIFMPGKKLVTVLGYRLLVI